MSVKTKWPFGIFSLLTLGVLSANSLWAQPQPPEKTPPGQERRARGRPGGPPPFELGRLLPPMFREQLRLSPDQEQQLAELEKEVKTKLEKLLTEEQIKQLVNLRPGGPGRAEPGEPARGPDRQDRKKADPPGKAPPPDKEPPTAGRNDHLPGSTTSNKGVAGIQWFATWESARAEAQRTNRPILLVSAAPHCAGVPGIW